MKCPTTEQLAKLQTGALDATQALRITDHVSACEACQDQLAALENVGRMIGMMPEPAMPADLWQGVAARITPQPRHGFAWRRAIAGAGIMVLLTIGSVLFNRTTAPPLATATGGAASFVSRHELLSAQDPLADRASIGVMLIAQEEWR